MIITREYHQNKNTHRNKGVFFLLLFFFSLSFTIIAHRLYIHYNSFIREGNENNTPFISLYYLSQDNLLLINHAKLMYQKSWNSGKEYMVSALFHYLDLDGNGFLQLEELQKVYFIWSVLISFLFFFILIK